MSLLKTLAITLATLSAIALLLAYLRLTAVLNPSRTKALRHGRRNPKEPTHLLVVLGSGGHTAEMLGMLSRATSPPPGADADADAGDSTANSLAWQDFSHRTWVVGSGDGISAERAKEFEDEMREQNIQQQAQQKSNNGTTAAAAAAAAAPAATTLRKPTAATTVHSTSTSYDIITVPRARQIHQPLLTAPISSIACLRACLDLLTTHTDPGTKDFPDIILCNGPATATILVLASVILRFFNVKGCATRGRLRTVYVESWARVNRLSLSGRLLVGVVDRFLVQWPQLEADAKKGGGRAEFVGVLV